MNLEEIERTLEKTRKGLRRDGADLVVNSLSKDCIELSLILEDNACVECIVGTEILLTKLRMLLSEVLPAVPTIVLHDPRNSC